MEWHCAIKMQGVGSTPEASLRQLQPAEKVVWQQGTGEIHVQPLDYFLADVREYLKAGTLITVEVPDCFCCSKLLMILRHFGVREATTLARWIILLSPQPNLPRGQFFHKCECKSRQP